MVRHSYNLQRIPLIRGLGRLLTVTGRGRGLPLRCIHWLSWFSCWPLTPFLIFPRCLPCVPHENGIQVRGERGWALIMKEMWALSFKRKGPKQESAHLSLSCRASWGHSYHFPLTKVAKHCRLICFNPVYSGHKGENLVVFLQVFLEEVANYLISL